LCRCTRRQAWPPPPHTLREFAGYAYPQTIATQERADKQRYLNRLLTAQRSLASYGTLLTGGSTKVPLTELYPYIAYPEQGDADQHRPYHAVSGVVIHHRFKDVEVARLGLIDLPGAGEAGLDIDQQFLQRLRDDLDLLLLVKRTVANDTFWSDDDWDSIGLADSVRGGVSLADFVCIVVNHDETQVSAEGLAVTTKKMWVEARKRDITVLTPNAARPETIQANLMAPLLQHLAQQLAEMDRIGRGNCGTNTSDLLDDVVGLVHRPQQPVGHRVQVGTLLLEDHGQVVPRCHILLS